MSALRAKRKLVLTGFVLTIDERYASGRLLAANLVCILSLVAYTACKPFKPSSPMK